ncbi:ABC transporter permease [Magnetospirillum moscoviense]|uniref:ABC transporter permease n=1 Tax=Magnetospirillum moscoviense TaxID=1437059 RepID=A0A178M9D9_9PROT|nr:ABC transporter permease [Magnetospirillum moscoviense]OAN44658.1 ABC transporter permease [Magnetospirillum moscoviense]
MNLAIRDIRHHWGRFVLTCLGLSLLLGVVISMIGIYRGLVADALVLVRAPAVDLWVVEGGTKGPFAEASRIPRDTRNAVARIDGIASAGMVTYQSMQIETAKGVARVLVVGFEPGRPGGPAVLAAGRTLERSHFEMVADIKTGLELGQLIRLGNDDYRVVGLTRGQVDSGGNPLIYLSLQDAQALQFELEGAAARNQAARGERANTNQVNAVLATIHADADLDSVARSVSRWKHLSALTQADQEAMLLSAVVDKARKQIGMFTVTLLTVSTVIIALIVHTMTLDKAREIATLKLIGAPDRTILALIIQQALAMGVISFSLGATLITLAADRFPRRVIVEAPDIAMLAAAVGVVCVIASLAGVRHALSIDPAQALGG